MGLGSLGGVGRTTGGVGSRVGQGGGGRDGGRFVACRRWNDDLVGNAENLADVDVAALGIDLGVILVEESSVHVVSSGDSLAGITPNHS